MQFSELNYNVFLRETIATTSIPAMRMIFPNVESLTIH